MIRLAVLFIAGGDDTSPVERGREALSAQAYPWYDAESDQPAALVPPEPWLDWSAVEDFLRGWSRWLDHFHFDIGFAGAQTLVLWILAGLILGMLTYALLRRLPRLGRRGADGTDEFLAPAQIEGLPAGARKVRDPLAEAERAIRAGDFDGATIFFYAYILTRLHQSAIIHLEKGKTNRRYGAEVGRCAPKLHQYFDRLVRIFEDTFFGRLPVDRAEFDALWQGRTTFALAIEESE